MLVLGLGHKGPFTWIIGFVAVVLASANVVGGFVVTDRMLEMFKKREPREAATVAGRRASDTTLESALPAPDRHVRPRTRFLSNPAHARRGNQIGAVGMLVAIVVTWIKIGGTSWWALALGMLIGGGFGAVAARKVKMTAMPQMVALFNGVGGGAAALIALAELHRILPEPGRPTIDIGVAIALSGADRRDLVLGLDDRVREAPGADRRTPDHVSRARSSCNLALLGACVAPGSCSPPASQDEWLLWVVVARRARCSACCSCCRSAAPTCRS